MDKTKHKKRSNIVLFVAEDLDYEGLNCYDQWILRHKKKGNASIRHTHEETRLLTPTIDSLARDGVMLLDLDFKIKELVYDEFPEDADAKSPAVKNAIEEGYRMAVEHLKDGYGWDYVDRIGKCLYLSIELDYK